MFAATPPRWLRRRIVHLSFPLLTLGCPSDAPATTVIPVDLQYCARKAVAVFAGTVRRMETVRADHTILTHVDFSDVSYATGGPNWGRTRISYEGGVVGNRRVFSIGQPEFKTGKRYILLVSSGYGSRGPWYIPIVGLYQGFFRVARVGDLSIVLDWADRPVVGVEGRHLVVASTGGKTSFHSASLVRVLAPEQDTGVRMTEKGFLRALRKLAKE